MLDELRESHVPVIGSFQVEMDEVDEEAKSNVMYEVVRKISITDNMEEIE